MGGTCQDEDVDGTKLLLYSIHHSRNIEEKSVNKMIP
jgi:hypothetical protein